MESTTEDPHPFWAIIRKLLAEASSPQRGKGIPRMPQQVPRLAAVFLLAVIALLVARSVLIPETFGERGHYRAAAADSIAAHAMKYAGAQECGMCHADVAALRASGNHRSVSCEVCHGPAAAHVAAPLDVKPIISRERGLCTLCHAYNASRPTGFPQVDSLTHNPGLPCIACHVPHAPVPPITPRDCGACHGQIARQKAVSHHVGLDCTTCHNAPEEHRANPRAVRPTKPTDRAFCEACHAGGVPGVPQVDRRTHGQPYLCWQCHYPHMPEAR